MQRGRTALYYAAVRVSKECLKLLVHEFTADPEEVDSVGHENVTAPKGFMYVDSISAVMLHCVDHQAVFIRMVGLHASMWQLARAMLRWWPT